jgi:hypothetical protein
LVGDVFDTLYWEAPSVEAKVFLLNVSSALCIDVVLGRVEADRVFDYVAGAVAGYRRNFNV